MRSSSVPTGGPYFDDLAIGMVFDDAPAVTLNPGLAASHQAIVGDRLRLPLDENLSLRVTGKPTHAHPALVWNLAIGQSTLVTQRVKANVFYRGLQFHGYPTLGDTLYTVTKVVALRQNSPKPGRYPTGLAVLQISTKDQLGKPVLDFWRCAMLPRRPGRIEDDTGHHDDLSAIGRRRRGQWKAPETWNLSAFRSMAPGEHFDGCIAGSEWVLTAGDVVSSAPELARLTLNIAAVHHDERAAESGRRLVYGGHTIAIASGQVCRVLPNLVTILGWISCDHLAPVYEGDTLTSTVRVERAQPLGSGGGVLQIRTVVSSKSGSVLDWRFAALAA
ncbi:MaoC family dehydratase [Nocardia sp. NBC_00508]|uniref:MaoC family dehydratase n=1 Tax=Nocardia sp. NBC_00508 TaxID=2975992 RepID=UPI002E81C43A|nr:MaoC family dehydratase [Nocardia sp. NBC_00508]WUD69683.1 MaoC family dehydratase [Nocardia sp. NBC_00508]